MAEATAAAEETPPPPESGWYRNTAATALTVVPDQYPSRTLAPGEAVWLPSNPRHRDLVPCDGPPPAPPAEAGDADTTGSEK